MVMARVRVRDRDRSVRAAKYGRSTTHFDDSQTQTVDERVTTGRACH